MKNYQYVLDIETPFIRKLYDKEDNYKVELLTPYGILEELKKLQEENADLEAKLAEKELLKKQLNEQIWLCEEKQQTIDEINKEFAKAVKDWKHLVKIEKTEKEQLKQQLAEKEDFIEDLMTGRVKPVIPRIKEIEKQYQDKISFALERLEIARRRIDCLRYNENKCLNKKDCVEDCLDEIENQIEELKKEIKHEN